MHECGKWVGRMWRVTSLSLPSASIHEVSKTDPSRVVGRERFRLVRVRTKTGIALSVEKSNG